MSCALAARVKLRSSTTKTKVRNKSVGILVMRRPQHFTLDAAPDQYSHFFGRCETLGASPPNVANLPEMLRKPRWKWVRPALDGDKGRPRCS